MIAHGPGAPPYAALVAFLVVLAVQRGAELVLSARHAKRLEARGAAEHGARHFPLLVFLHALFPIALTAEVLAFSVRPGPLWPAFLALWIAAQWLSYAAVRALGDRWTVGIWVLPGARLVKRGPYRFLRHPNYVAVALELFAAPLMFGAWRTAVLVTALNLFALSIRIRAEERALRRH